MAGQIWPPRISKISLTLMKTATRGFWRELTELTKNQTTYSNFGKLYRILKFEFGFWIHIIKSTKKTSSFSSAPDNFYNFCPPYWIRNFQFRKFSFKFEISTLRNSLVLLFVEFRLFLLFSSDTFYPPSWISNVLKFRFQIKFTCYTTHHRQYYAN